MGTLAFISSLVDYNLTEMDWNKVFLKFKENIRFGAGLTPKLVLPASHDELTLQWKIICTIVLYLRFHKWMMIDLVASFSILSAYISLRSCNDFYSLMTKPENQENVVLL